VREVVKVRTARGSGQITAHGEVGDEDSRWDRPPRLVERRIADQRRDQ